MENNDEKQEKTFDFRNKNEESVKKIASAMKNRERFKIITDDPDFKPLAHDKRSAMTWLTVAGLVATTTGGALVATTTTLVGGTLISIGTGALFLAFIDPEPMSKLGLLVGGSFATILGGGGIALLGSLGTLSLASLSASGTLGVITTILVTRSHYKSVMRKNNETGLFEWTLEPK